MESFNETPCQRWCGQMCPSCLSLLLLRLLPLTGFTRQPRLGSGLRFAPDRRQSVTYAGFLIEYGLCACARVFISR